MNSNYISKILRSSSTLPREGEHGPINLTPETTNVRGKMLNVSMMKVNNNINSFVTNENLINGNNQISYTNYRQSPTPNNIVVNGAQQNPTNSTNLKINNLEINYSGSVYTSPSYSVRSNSSKAISRKTVLSTISEKGPDLINPSFVKNSFISTNSTNQKSLLPNYTQTDTKTMGNHTNGHNTANNNLIKSSSSSNFASMMKNGLSNSINIKNGNYVNSLESYQNSSPKSQISTSNHSNEYSEYISTSHHKSSSLIYNGNNSTNNFNNNINNQNKNSLNTINSSGKRMSIDKYYEYINITDHSRKQSSNTVNEGVKTDINGNDQINYIDTKYKSISMNNTAYYNNVVGNINQGKKDMSFYINLEDLMILEEKLYQILENFRASKPSSRNCFEWWNFYNYCLIGGKFEFYFKEENHKKIVRDSCALELISIIISFEASTDNKILTTTINILKNMLYLIHQNFLIICDYLVSKISSDSYSNVWVNKIQNLILTKLNKRLKKGENVVLLKQNNDNIFASLKNIFRIYSPTNTSNKQIQVDFSMIIYYVKNLTKVTVKTLNEHFRNRIIRLHNKNGIKIPENLIVEEGESLPSIPVPYLDKKISNNKIFTLVLDLDETLIHFKINPESNKGILRLRPGLQEFLSTLSKIYELVVFTAATQDYADSILDSIEKDANYFDYRLYRQHAIIIENDFVKDLSKLGRDLSKTLIIDNMPQNFKLQKDNGIFIKTFYGEDADDNALFDLIEILTKITENYDSSTDLRREIKKFKNEIFRKITTNVDRPQNTKTIQDT